MRYKNLVLLGTSHIAKQSLREVEEAIKKEKPEIIALELDRKRLAALVEKGRPKVRLMDIRKIGIKGFLFNIIGAWAENYLGKKTGVKPGSEMKKAFEIAKEKGIKIALIDQDIEVTLRRVSKSLTWKEKWNFFVDAFKTIVLKKREVVFDLSTVPSEKVIKKLVAKVKKRYPNLYKVLVKERNMIMAKKLANLCNNYHDKKILAIIGAGHEKEILGLIKKFQKECSVGYSFSTG